MTFCEFVVKLTEILKNTLGDRLLDVQSDVHMGDCEFIDSITSVDFALTHTADNNSIEYNICYTDEFLVRHLVRLTFKEHYMYGTSLLLFGIFLSFIKIGCINTFISAQLSWAMCHFKISIMNLISEAIEKNMPDVIRVLLSTDFVKTIIDSGYFKVDNKLTLNAISSYMDGSTMFDIDVEELEMFIDDTDNVECKAVILEYINEHKPDEEEIGL